MKEREVADLLAQADEEPLGLKVWTNNPHSARTRVSTVRKKYGLGQNLRMVQVGENEIWLVPEEVYEQHRD